MHAPMVGLPKFLGMVKLKQVLKQLFCGNWLSSFLIVVEDDHYSISF